MGDIVAGLGDELLKLVDRGACLVFFAGEINQKSQTGGITAGIQRDDLSFGIFLAQLLDGDHADSRSRSP